MMTTRYMVVGTVTYLTGSLSGLPMVDAFRVPYPTREQAYIMAGELDGSVRHAVMTRNRYRLTNVRVVEEQKNA